MSLSPADNLYLFARRNYWFLFYLFYYPLSFCKIPKPVFLDTPSMLEVSIRGSSIGIPTRCTEAQLKNQVDSREQAQSSIFSHFFSLKSRNVLNLAISVFTSSSLWSLTLALVCLLSVVASAEVHELLLTW